MRKNLPPMRIVDLKIAFYSCFVYLANADTEVNRVAILPFSEYVIINIPKAKEKIHSFSESYMNSVDQAINNLLNLIMHFCNIYSDIPDSAIQNKNLDELEIIFNEKTNIIQPREIYLLFLDALLMVRFYQSFNIIKDFHTSRQLTLEASANEQLMLKIHDIYFKFKIIEQWFNSLYARNNSLYQTHLKDFTTIKKFVKNSGFFLISNMKIVIPALIPYLNQLNIINHCLTSHLGDC